MCWCWLGGSYVAPRWAAPFGRLALRSFRARLVRSCLATLRPALHSLRARRPLSPRHPLARQGFGSFGWLRSALVGWSPWYASRAPSLRLLSVGLAPRFARRGYNKILQSDNFNKV